MPDTDGYSSKIDKGLPSSIPTTIRWLTLSAIEKSSGGALLGYRGGDDIFTRVRVGLTEKVTIMERPNIGEGVCQENITGKSCRERPSTKP